MVMGQHTSALMNAMGAGRLSGIFYQAYRMNGEKWRKNSLLCISCKAGFVYGWVKKSKQFKRVTL